MRAGSQSVSLRMALAQTDTIKARASGPFFVAASNPRHTGMKKPAFRRA